MKRQIAAFLGELAEELGWAPELEESRVRPEETGSENRTSERMPSVVPRFASPVDILSAELKQLRKTVNHLGSEVRNDGFNARPASRRPRRNVTTFSPAVRAISASAFHSRIR